MNKSAFFAMKSRIQVFFKGLLQSGMFLLTGMAVMWGLLYYAIASSLPYAQRVLPLNLFSVLCIVSLANHIFFAEASYLRAHKEEPFMMISILSGVLTLVLAFVLIPIAGLGGAVASYALPALLGGLLGGSLIFFGKRRYWTMKVQSL